MGEVTRYRKRHFVGLNADLASVTAEIGDTYLASDKDKLYYKTTAGWKTGLGYEYVPRNVVGWDFTEANFTIDGGWHVDELNLSAIVPAGAVAVHLRLYLMDNAASTYISLRSNATTKSNNSITAFSTVANVGVDVDTILNIDADRLVDFFSSAAFDSIDIAVMGWFI